MARSFSGQTKRETIQKKYGLTDHQWDLFLTHTHDEAKELFFTNKYWTGTKKPDDVKWIDLDEGIMKRFIKEVNERLVKSQVKVDYPLMKWRLLPLIRRKPKNDRKAEPPEPTQDSSEPAQDSSERAQGSSEPTQDSSEPTNSRVPFDPIADAGGRKAG